jgi:hypothetical protein
MGYLNNEIVTVDAILTKKGRELLARGDGSFKITQFALGDDEVDYTLYNTSHPDGSAFYGQAIENLPVLEAFPDENQVLKSKLITLPRGTSRIPVIKIGGSITLDLGETFTIRPQTLNYLGQTSIVETGGYVVTIADVRLVSEFVGVGINTEEADRLNRAETIGTNVSKTVIGNTFNLRATTVERLFNGNSSLVTSVTVIGRDSGARLSVPLTVNRNS